MCSRRDAWPFQLSGSRLSNIDSEVGIFSLSVGTALIDSKSLLEPFPPDLPDLVDFLRFLELELPDLRILTLLAVWNFP